MICTLCSSKTQHFYWSGKKQYVRCINCKSVLLCPDYYIDPEKEKERYAEHNNDVTDPRYQNFLHPVTSRIEVDFNTDSTGLDYGCGTGPVATEVLKKKGYHINLFDPFFVNQPEVLKQPYNFIICSEVMEHFHLPYKEFRQLYNLLLPGGKLYCKTSTFSDTIDFDKWYYKNDPTHVFFYTEESLNWIKNHFSFREVEHLPDLIMFRK